MKKTFVTIGFPRSGNNYLNQTLCFLYYPNESPHFNKHSVIEMEKYNKFIVPYRNPLDSIASWASLPINKEFNLQSHINFYIRFNTAVIENLHKAVLMNFDNFTKDINYIKDRVLKNFDIDTNHLVTDAQVKETMLANNKAINLPKNNEEELTLAKDQLQNTFGFDKCLELYAQFKAQSL